MYSGESNRFREIDVFVHVVEAQSFSGAARRLRMTPSAVSKLIGRLEERLGIPLIRRSTRRLQVTAEGNAFYENSVRILAELAAAEREAAAGAAPRGRLRVNSNVPFGHHSLIPLLPRFQALHPQVAVDVVLTDHVVDLIEERADVAIRTGPLATPDLIARKLFSTGMALVAAPHYLEAHGWPETPADLEGHRLLGFCFSRAFEGWPFIDAAGHPVVVPPVGGSLVNDGESMRVATLAGMGIARLSRWHLRDDLAAGRVVPLLEDFNPGDEEIFYAVYVGQGKHLPARVRAFLDFLADNIRPDGSLRGAAAEGLASM